jgi:hypothetical protein
MKPEPKPEDEKQDPIPRIAVAFPVSNTKGGVLPGIDLNNSAQLLDIMDGSSDPS